MENLIFSFLRFFQIDRNQLYFLLALTLVDIICGVLCAWIRGNSKHAEIGGLESHYFIKGIYKKVANFFLILAGAFLDYTLKLQIIAQTTIIILNVEELISILENLSLLGVKVPKVIQKHLEVVQRQHFSDDEEEEA